MSPVDRGIGNEVWVRVEGENDEGVIEPVTPCSELCANSIVEPIEIATITTASRLSSFSPQLDSVKSCLSPALLFITK